MNKMLNILKSHNLTLRPITPADTPLIVRWRNTDFVRNNFLYRGKFTEEIHKHWLETKVDTGEVVQFIIEQEENGTQVPVGSVYLRDIDTENSCAEFGIFIGEESALGKGIGTESAKVMLDFAHNQLGLHRVFLRLLADNISAYKAYRKAGYVAEGIFRDMKKIDGKYKDIMFLSYIQNNGGGYNSIVFFISQASEKELAA